MMGKNCPKLIGAFSWSIISSLFKKGKFDVGSKVFKSNIMPDRADEVSLNSDAGVTKTGTHTVVGFEQEFVM